MEDGRLNANLKARTYTISDLSSEFNVTTRALRLYEESELLAPAREGSKRIYLERDRVRLRLILRGKRLGYKLSEIREIFDMYESKSGERGQILLLLAKMKDSKNKLLSKKRDVDLALEEIDRLDRKLRKSLEELNACEQKKCHPSD